MAEAYTASEGGLRCSMQTLHRYSTLTACIDTCVTRHKICAASLTRLCVDAFLEGLKASGRHAMQARQELPVHRPRVLHEEDVCNEREQPCVSCWRLAICYGADHAADTLQKRFSSHIDDEFTVRSNAGLSSS